MSELGNILSRARRARGITLEDVERDTHVSRRYLVALEAEDFSIFPAPVYARGFLRTYARYLGLNPEELMHVFPNGDTAVDVTPLPTVTRPPAPLINVNWLVAGLVMIFLLGAGLLLLRGGGSGTVVGDLPARSTTTAGVQSAQNGNGAETDASVQGKTIGPVSPGLLPDFVGADIASSLALLHANQIGYVIVEVEHNSTPRGIVISQRPGGGARINDDAEIQLVVSTGPRPQ